MRVDDLINELEDMMNEAKVLPLTGGKAVIDTETVLDILDELKDAFPSEFGQAKGIVADRNQILAEAKKQAEVIVRKGEERKKALVEEHEVTRAAEARANEIITDAKKKANEIKRGANEFIEDIMKRTDDSLTGMIGEVRKARQDFKATKRG